MSRHKYISCLFTIYLAQIVFCNVVVSDITTKDQCKELCDDLPTGLTLVGESSSVCERGCRFFNLIDAKDNTDISKTKQECHNSCNEAYIGANFETCIVGCDEMVMKNLGDGCTSFLVYIEQEGQSNIMVVQPELQQFEVEFLSDSVLRSQSKNGYGLEYKIPETHIRTMPINAALDNFGIPSDYSIKQYPSNGDWLDCASRNSGIPRWILVSAILMAVLIGVWLIFASEKKEPIQSSEVPVSMLVNEVEYSAPPKYNLESEKV